MFTTMGQQEEGQRDRTPHLFVLHADLWGSPALGHPSALPSAMWASNLCQMWPASFSFILPRLYDIKLAGSHSHWDPLHPVCGIGVKQTASSLVDWWSPSWDQKLLKLQLGPLTREGNSLTWACRLQTVKGSKSKTADDAGSLARNDWNLAREQPWPAVKPGILGV